MPNICATRCTVTGPLETIARFRTDCIRPHSVDSTGVGLDFEAILPSPQILHEPPWAGDSRVSDGLAVLGVTLPGGGTFAETLEGMMERYPWVRREGITTTEALKTWLVAQHPECIALAEAAIAKVRATGYRYLNHWRDDHWGVPYNALDYEESAGPPFSFRFGAPRTFPLEVFEALAARYPALSFDCVCICGWELGGEGVFNPRPGQSPFTLGDADRRLYTLAYGEPPEDDEHDEEADGEVNI